MKIDLRSLCVQQHHLKKHSFMNYEDERELLNTILTEKPLGSFIVSYLYAYHQFGSVADLFVENEAPREKGNMKTLNNRKFYLNLFTVLNKRFEYLFLKSDIPGYYEH